MLVIGAVLVFVGLVGAGIFVVLVRLARSRDEQHAEAMERAVVIVADGVAIVSAFERSPAAS